MFRCSCTICKKYGKEPVIYWKRIDKINNNNINWIKISWFSSIGLIDSKLVYMKYIWGLKYIRFYTKTDNIKEVPYIFILFCRSLHYFNIIYKKLIYKLNKYNY